MAKIKKQNSSKLSSKKTNKQISGNSEKYVRQKQLTAERVRKYRAKMTEEQWEEKRNQDRQRYWKKKQENLIKPISELNKREQREKRKAWKRNSKTYRDKKKNEKQALSNTPPNSEDENNGQERMESNQKKRGRKYVKRERSKAYRKIIKQDKEIEDLKKKLVKYRQRLHRKDLKLKSVMSPSPNSKVKNLVGRDKISPQVKRRLFLGYALEKQLMTQKKNNVPQSKQAQLSQKVIGSKILRRYRVQKYFSKLVSYKFNRYETNTNLDLTYERKASWCKTSKLKEKLLGFYEDDTVSKMCPGKRDFKKKQKQKKQRRILLDTLKNLHKRFVAESGCSIAYSTFSRARPFWVTRPNPYDRNTCACIVHSNIEFLISSLKTIKAVNIRSGKEAVETIVCSLKDQKCMMGQCDICKNKQIIFNANIDNDINVKYYQWRIQTDKKELRGKIQTIKRMCKVKEIIKLHKLKEILKLMMIKFKKHIFHMSHQAEQKKLVQSTLFGRELMFMLDFSENYCAKYETEVQAMHFGASKKQITLHTVVLYFHNGEKVVPRSYCTVSDNLAHQAYAVWAHLDPILENVSKEFPQTKIIHFFSDSPSSQYRNRINLHLLRKNLSNHFPFLKYYTWNFSESGHGKGPMDGIGGSLKRRADELVSHGSNITCAADFVDSFKNSKITVIEVSSQSVESSKKNVPSNIIPVPKIMQIKQISCCVDTNTMFGRSLSCFKCLPDIIDNCSHYKMNEIFPIKQLELSARKKQKLTVQEVWSSDDDYDDFSMQINRPNLTIIDQPGPSNLNTNNSVSCDEASILIGTYVLVRFYKETKKINKVQQFVGICQSEVDNGEIKVMFLKEANKDKIIFIINEKDTFFVTTDQIVAVLPQPNLILKGNRVYYKFNYPISVF